MQPRLITKVSIIEPKVAIKFDEGDRTKLLLTSEDEALPSFYEAMQAFLPLLIESAGLDSEYWGEGNVTGIALKHDEVGTAIAISGKCKVEDKYVSISSPSRLVYPENQALVDKLVEEAIGYLDGKRSQQSLPFSLPDSKNFQSLMNDKDVTISSRGDSLALRLAR